MTAPKRKPVVMPAKPPIRVLVAMAHGSSKLTLPVWEQIYRGMYARIRNALARQK